MQSQDPSKKTAPDISKANEEYSSEVENSELGTEMLDYGNAGPGASRDDSSLKSEDSTAKDPEDSKERSTSAGSLD